MRMRMPLPAGQLAWTPASGQGKDKGKGKGNGSASVRSRLAITSFRSMSSPVVDRTTVLREWLAAAPLLAPEWKEPVERETVRWVRRARVLALLEAFQLGTPDAFENGQFLAGAVRERYAKTSALMEKHEGRHRAASSMVPPRLFWWLLGYRREAERLLTFHDGLLEAGIDGVFQGVAVTLAATEQARGSVAEIDELLLEMISPDDRKLRGDAIEGWPDADLEVLRRREVWGDW